MKVKIHADGFHAQFYCPGCLHYHMLPINGADNAWDFNNNADSPTFKPSILARGVDHLTEAEETLILAGVKIEPRKYVCHSFVTDGKINFLHDCTHSLAGKTIDLPEMT